MKKPNITPGPWKVHHDTRLGPSGSKHADQWWLDSGTRNGMALLEVWEITEETWKNPARAAEQRDTLYEVQENAQAIAAVPELLEALEQCLLFVTATPHDPAFHDRIVAALTKAGYTF
jgi:hypothetical protein